MENRIIGIITAGTNLNSSDIMYEVDMLEFSNVFFKALSQEKIRSYLFGGTALNKGFFGERQRLSKDLDLEIDARDDFTKTAHKIESCIIKTGYRNIRVDEHAKRHSVYVFLGDAVGELKLDIVPQQNRIKPIMLTLHSLLEYVGVPAKTIEVKSYPFEYLLAYKLHALHRRMLYKDIYDSYTGLNLPMDGRKLVRYIGMFGNAREMLREIINNIENGSYDRDELGYEKLVPEKYKVPVRNMLYELRVKLSSLPVHL
ncbi:nucleotidyl transferase AbiEii/AbiGii toxin family protein [Candidatus Parvarchaeota archaeon]|jgi:hypothetical protein|nr:nucleotidyl transferase AbiEii/AbiGii toxin family protein [Candidatus Parvarchaeota archaeon]